MAQFPTNRPTTFYYGNPHNPLWVPNAGNAAARDLYFWSAPDQAWIGVTNGFEITNGPGRSALLNGSLAPIYTNASRNVLAPWSTNTVLGTNPIPVVMFTNIPAGPPTGYVIGGDWSVVRPYWSPVAFRRSLGTNTSIPVPFCIGFTNALPPNGHDTFITATFGWTNNGSWQLPGAIDVWAYTNIGNANGELLKRFVITNDLSTTAGIGTFVWYNVDNFTNAVFRWRYRTGTSNSPWSGTITNRIRP